MLIFFSTSEDSLKYACTSHKMTLVKKQFQYSYSDVPQTMATTTKFLITFWQLFDNFEYP